MLLRCTTEEYANRFLETGNVRFGMPIEWIQEEKKNGKGRGDLLEGCFAGIKNSSQESLKIYSLIRDDIISFYNKKNKMYYYQSEKVLYYRTFCLFGLNESLFDKYERSGNDHKLHQISRVTEQYFSEFYPLVTKDNYKLLVKENKPVLLIIHNPHIFFERVKCALYNFGLRKDELIIYPVTYQNLQKSFFVDGCSPSELFVKDAFFKKQSEIRIVINSNRKEIIDKLELCNGILNLGEMKDIASCYDYYFHDFLAMKGKNSILFTLPNPIKYELDDSGIMCVIEQALRDELPNSPITLEQIEMYIAPLLNTLKNDYNIYYDKYLYIFYNADGSICKKLLDIWVSHYSHGQIYFNDGLYEEAIDSFTKAIHFEENRDESWFARGLSQRYINNFREMINDYNHAIDLNPKNPNYLLERGYQLFFSGYNDKGLLDFKNGLIMVSEDHVNNNPSIKYMMGVANVALGKTNKGIELLTECIDSNICIPYSFYDRGVAYNLVHEEGKARNDFIEYLNNNGDYSKLKLYLNDKNPQMLNDIKTTKKNS